MAQNNQPGAAIVTDNAISSRVFLGNTSPSYPVAGDFWMDNTQGSMATGVTTTYTSTGGETSVTASYSVGYEFVFLNGVKLVRGTDYTATNGTSITGLTALVAGDIVDVFGMTSGSTGLQGATGTQGTTGLQGTQGLQGFGYAQLQGTQGTSGTTPTVWVSSTQSSNFNAVTRNQYFVNTASAVTATLAASPTLGDEVRIFDATGSAATNNITVNPNGNNLQGSVQNLLININYGGATLLYTGSTYGWKVA